MSDPRHDLGGRSSRKNAGGSVSREASAAGVRTSPSEGPPGRVLVVDDEEVMRDILGGLMKRGGHEVKTSISGEEALEQVEAGGFDVVLLDLMLPGMDGLETLVGLKRLDPHLPVVMITAYATVENAIEAMKRGAFDYVVKPFRNDEVELIVRRAVADRRLRLENLNLKRELRGRFGIESIVGQSAPMRRVFELVAQVAPALSTVLIQGESGTGKELVARAIHQLSQRSHGPFVVVNSGNMPADLLESNLFGHTRGAFTGAVAAKKGLFEVADGGSLFFDEISNIDTNVQVKLLRVLQEREFMPLGGTGTLQADVRIIAATNIDLGTLVDAGSFREDLYYRINVIRLMLPPLRDRREDIPLLVNHFLARYAHENGKQLRGVTPAAMRWLETREWPGNVRELENVIQRAVVLARSDMLDLELVSDEEYAPRPRTYPQFPRGSYKEALEEFERDLIADALSRASGVQKKAAELLGIKPTTLNEKIKRLGLRRG